MSSESKEGRSEDVALPSRQQLIELLLESNRRSVFQFTRPWLERQWTGRLRRLWRSVCGPGAGEAQTEAGASGWR